MATNRTQPNDIITGLIGPADFCQRLAAPLSSRQRGLKVVSSSVADAWSMLIGSRPNLLIIDVGLQHSDRIHRALRQFLARMRERYKRETYVCLVLSAPEKIAFGGDLLFANEFDLTPSGFIDTFAALPPGLEASTPGLYEQIFNVVEALRAEIQRRGEDNPPLPALGASGWVQSLADPRSRDLWGRWLPRYASYTNENPIIVGPTGTGKTNLAAALHMLSGRKGQFVTITPRDFSSSELVQAELFGAVAGAYTGAVDKWGLVQKAEKGTLFIDELQSIDKDLQGKLITFIENKVYRRVGSSESVAADVRFVFASNRTLYEMMESGVLRDDFAYRLERMQLELPALQERRLDIVAGLAYALAKIQRQRPQALPVYGVSSAAYGILFSQSWPGNLRQLENNIAKLCELTDINGLSLIDERIVANVMGSRLSGRPSSTPEVISRASLRMAAVALEEQVGSLEESIEKFSEIVRMSALEAAGGDVNNATRIISDHEKTLALMAETVPAGRELKYFK